MQAQQNETVSVVLPGRLYKAHKPCTRENDHALIEPRPQGLFPKKMVGSPGDEVGLRSKRFQSSYCAKVREEAKKRLKGEGEGRRGNACPQTPRFWKAPLDIHGSPSPPASLIFFCSCPSFLDEPREETLATQATLEAQEEADCTSMLSSIDTCQNSII